MILPLLLSLCLLLPSKVEGEGDPPVKSQQTQPSKVPDLRPENAIQRIKQRNLFHPTRGLLPEVAAGVALPSAQWPVLVGTTLAGKSRFAMLRGIGATGAVTLKTGEAHEGFEVVAIESERVQVKLLATQETNWIGLDQPGEEKTSGSSEYQALLGGTKPAAAFKPASLAGAIK